MAISPVTNNPSSATSINTATSASGIAETQEQFMTLLVSQMKYQDPLKPMDNAQMTSQIAQINTVSGVNQLNKTVEALATQFNALQSLQASNLLGKEAWVASDQLQLSDGVAQFAVDLPARVDGLEIEVLDARGTVVYSQQLDAQPAGEVPLYWDGSTDAGSQSADGLYTLRVRQLQGGDSSPATTWTAARVLSVGMGEGTATLELDGLGSHSVSAVRRLSTPLAEARLSPAANSPASI